MLAFGLTTLIGSALLQTANVNIAVTAHNAIAFFATSLYFIGTFLVLIWVSIQEDRSERRATVRQVYLGAVVFLIFITFITVR
jgi:cell division protein FtsW (lipid II flippase)